MNSIPDACVYIHMCMYVAVGQGSIFLGEGFKFLGATLTLDTFLLNLFVHHIGDKKSPAGFFL